MTDLHKAIAKIIAAAWADQDFQRDLAEAGEDRKRVDDVLARKGLKLPDIPDHSSGKVRFLVNTEDVRHVVIPQRPEFTDEDMGLMIRLRQEQSIDTGCKSCGGTGNGGILDSIKKRLGDE